jgi:regulator of sirC expression with transglutaminase-like and TPR domain
MTTAQRQIAALAAQPDQTIDLATGALAISRLFQPELSPSAYLERLDDLAADAARRIPDDEDLLGKVAALNDYLFGELGFAGNQDDFYDPRNSFLDQVIERRLGIPISLALIYVEVAGRLGLPAFGVGFPAHFLVRIGRGATALMLDVYAGGVSLAEDELDRRLAEVFGDGVFTIRSNPSLLRPATKREILIRMLRNLVGVYRQHGDQNNLLEALSAALTLEPDLVDERRERGLLYRDLGYAPAALDDLGRFVELSDDASQIVEVQAVLAELRARPMRLH